MKTDKFDLENNAAGGPLEIKENGEVDLTNLEFILGGFVENKDFIVHIEYNKEKHKYGFAVYAEKE